MNLYQGIAVKRPMASGHRLQEAPTSVLFSGPHPFPTRRDGSEPPAPPEPLGDTQCRGGRRLSRGLQTPASSGIWGSSLFPEAWSWGWGRRLAHLTLTVSHGHATPRSLGLPGQVGAHPKCSWLPSVHQRTAAHSASFCGETLPRVVSLEEPHKGPGEAIPQIGFLG